MIDLIFPADSLTELRRSLHDPALESSAIVLARPVVAGERQRLLAQRMAPAPADAYAERTGTSVRLHDGYVLGLENEARREGWSVVYCHTHPGERGVPEFSPRDDASEKALAGCLARRNPSPTHAALLIGEDGVRARVLGRTDMPVRVVEVGRDVRFHATHDPTPTLADEHHRQILAFGEAGQRLLHGLRVGVVGVGGTGSVVVQQLAHLGIDAYVLVDADRIAKTNLNRVAGARRSDVGELKTDVAARMIRDLRPAPRIEAIEKDVVLEGVARALLATDFVFCCTDSHASRDLLNHLAYRYFLPVLNVGVHLDPSARGDLKILGEIGLLAPGLPCLVCHNTLDPTRVAEEYANGPHREANPYFGRDVGAPQPAVMSLTSTVSSLGITMFLGAVVGIPARARLQHYDGNRGRVSAIEAKSTPGCVVCAPESFLGTGDLYPLPARREP